ncbi:MAG: hypothetical protein GXO33_04125 [Epsilonproteobacteria bacterium]|nr:hypothetical protein [Campylobacterota bacterium]
MRRTLWMSTLALATLLVTGCSQKNEVTDLFRKDLLYDKALQYTRGAQVVRELETKAAITATLLNEVLPDRYRYDDGVYFFVGIVTDMNVKKFKSSYSLKLIAKQPLDKKLKEAIKAHKKENKELKERGEKAKTFEGFDPVSIQPVDDTSELYQMMPNVNRWGKYFLVKYPAVKDKKLVLKFSLYPYEPVTLPFVRATPRR